jgi:uncharacterized membrane protein
MSVKKSQTKMPPKKAITLAALLLISFLTAALGAATRPAYAQDYWLSGNVTDRNGQGLSGVTVSLYSTYGSLLYSTTTSSSAYFYGPGYFNFYNIQGTGAYTLSIQKPGYISITQQITISSSQLQETTNDLGTFQMTPGLSLTTPVLSIVATTGSEFQIPFTLENSGTQTENVTISTSTPQGWTATALSGTYQVTQISLPSGQSSNLQLVITVPANATPGTSYSLTLTAAGFTTQTVTYNVQTVSPTTATLTGTAVDELGNPLNGANVTAYTSTGTLINSAQTAADGTFTLQLPTGNAVMLDFTKDGYLMTSKTITLTTAGQTTNLGNIVMNEVVQLTANLLATSATPGSTVNLSFTVTNYGNSQVTVPLSASCPSGLTARVLDSSSHEVLTASVPAGQSLSLQLAIDIPSTAQVGSTNTVILTAIAAVNSTLNFTIQTAAQTTGTVVGKVVDEEGNPLASATVIAYFPDGTIINTTQTAPDGSYAITLPTGEEISLSFTESGYVSATTTVSLTYAGQSVNIGVTSLKEAVSLTSSLSSVVTFPGELTIPFSLTNAGNTAVTVLLTPSCPSGWGASIIDSSSSTITSATVEPSNTASNFQLQVNIPLGTTGTFNVGLTATGQTTSTLSFTVNVEAPTATNLALISCQEPGEKTTPGDTADFNIVASNPFSVPTHVLLSVTSIPANWAAIIKDSVGEQVTEVYLNAGQSLNLVVEVNTNATSPTGSTYNLEVNAKSEEYNITQSVPISVTLAVTTQEVTITAALPQIAIVAGNKADYSVTVANVGVTNRLLFLYDKPPADWTAVFTSSGQEVTSLYLYAGNTSNLVFTVTPPSTVAVGSYTIPVQVESSTGEVFDAMNLTTTITGSYNMTMTPSTYLVSTNIGGTTSWTTTVTNTGYSPLTDVVLEVTSPVSNWNTTVTPALVNTLGPLQSATFNVAVTVSSNTVSGDYLVTIQGSSDQVSSASTQVRVTANTPTSYGIYIIIIAIIFVVILVLVFRKFKRR